MKYFFILSFFLFLSCDSQINSEKTNIQFEDIYHHYFNLTTENFVMLDSQEKVDHIYNEIGKHYGGTRKPPIPQVTLEEKFIVFKPNLKNSNDVEIVNVEMANDILYINTKPFFNPEISEKNRIAPSILIKIYTNQNLKKVITNTLN